ncbi:MAG TPA: glycosyltransferase family 2 protein [Bryobacteraceae bacterium]|nr:glycosyltransferase family 2 protein [Bryobacteraceae bacterium]
MSHSRYVLIPREPPRLLSIVLPIYNEQETIPLLVKRLNTCLDALGLPVEVIFVNDGSSDASVEQLLELAHHDSRFKLLSLARNFGHQAAATAGLDYACGDAVVLMDADLQDPPELIHDMVREYQKGYDVVYAHRTGRQGESRFKRVTAWTFYRLMKTLVHRELPADVGDFRLISRTCLDGLRSMRETHRFLRGMVAWVGFPQVAVPFVRPPRAAGATKYPVRKMLLFAWNAAVSFSPLPLRFSFALGFVLTAMGMCYGGYALIRTALGLYTVPGWTSSIVLTCLVGGSIMISLGILGEYVARIFEEVKGRPLYLVGMTANIPEIRRADAVPYAVGGDAVDGGSSRPAAVNSEAAAHLRSEFMRGKP